MEYNYRYGRRITEEIKGGRLIHEELEEETNVPVILQPKNYADAIYKNLYQSHVALGSLKKKGKTREVQVYGSVTGYKLVGKIDELQLKDGTVMIMRGQDAGEPEDALGVADAHAQGTGAALQAPHRRQQP